MHKYDEMVFKDYWPRCATLASKFMRKSAVDERLNFARIRYQPILIKTKFFLHIYTLTPIEKIYCLKIFNWLIIFLVVWILETQTSTKFIVYCTAANERGFCCGPRGDGFRTQHWFYYVSTTLSSGAKAYCLKPYPQKRMKTDRTVFHLTITVRFDFLTWCVWSAYKLL